MIMEQLDLDSIDLPPLRAQLSFTGTRPLYQHSA